MAPDDLYAVFNRTNARDGRGQGWRRGGGGYTPYHRDGTTAHERGDEDEEPEYEEYHVTTNEKGHRYLKGDDTGDGMHVMNQVGAEMMTGSYESIYGEMPCQEAVSLQMDKAMAVESIAVTYLAANGYAAVTTDMLGDIHEDAKALRQDFERRAGLELNFEFETPEGRIVPCIELAYDNPAVIEAILAKESIDMMGMQLRFHRRAKYEELVAGHQGGLQLLRVARRMGDVSHQRVRCQRWRR